MANRRMRYGRSSGSAQGELVALPLDTRRGIIEGMRRAVLSTNGSLSADEPGWSRVRLIHDCQSDRRRDDQGPHIHA